MVFPWPLFRTCVCAWLYVCVPHLFINQLLHRLLHILIFCLFKKCCNDHGIAAISLKHWFHFSWAYLHERIIRSYSNYIFTVLKILHNESVILTNGIQRFPFPASSPTPVISTLLLSILLTDTLCFFMYFYSISYPFLIISAKISTQALYLF